MSEMPEPLRAILFDYCHADWADEVNELPLDVVREDWAYDASLFKSQLREAILKPAFSPAEFSSATGESLNSQEELIDRLRSIWSITFPNEEP
jgi:hypothetical protein